VVPDTGRKVLELKRGWPLFLFGEPGCGKSAIAGLLFEHAHGRPMWVNAFDGFKAVAMSCASPQPLWGYGAVPLPEWDHWDELKRRSVVVLDDVGLRGRATDAQYDALQKFLLVRQDKPTVLTSNLNLKAIESVFDDRTASRIAEGTSVKVAGKDRRITGR